MRYGAIFFLLLTGFFSNGQNAIQGKVFDAVTKQPIPFANIVFNHEESFSTTTDIDGRFLVQNPSQIAEIKCSHVAYQGKTITQIPEGKIEIELTPLSAPLDELVIVKRSPAAEIIKKVIANKDKNNPEKLSSFKYTSYNKVVYDLKSDSTRVRPGRKKRHMFLMESVTERKFLYPDLSVETVTATKVSGFQNPSFASVATDFQPFSFYQDNIQLMNIRYVNPISDGSLRKYRFHIEDTLYRDQDTVFVISFTPRKNRNFDALTGLLYINTKNYAVQNVVARTFEQRNVAIEIHQQYALVENRYWFPQQLDYEVIFNNFPNTHSKMSIEGKSYIRDVSVNVPLRRAEFGIESVTIAESAPQQDSVFWNRARISTLNDEERETYRVVDSLGKKYRFDSHLAVFEKLAKGRLDMGLIDLDLSKTIVYNKYEGFRPGVGIVTNDRFSKRFTYGGFVGYGLRDEDAKYGNSLQFRIFPQRNFYIGVHQENNLVEVGAHDRYTENSFFDFRRFLGYRYDKIDRYDVSANFSVFRYVKAEVGLNRTQISPQYDYDFDGIANFRNYTNADVSAKFRFAYKEKVINTLNQSYSTGTNYPLLLVGLSKGLKNSLDGDFDYFKVEMSLSHGFYTNSFGKTQYMVEAGMVDSNLPYGLLFTGEGSYDKGQPYLIANTFQTLKPYEFLSDRYVRLFFSQNFGSLLFRGKNFRPDVIYHQNLEYGNLKNPDIHNLVTFATPRKIFVESGLQLNNVIRTELMNVFNIGYGFAVFYRYGAYANPDFEDNLALKATLSLSLN